MSEWIDPVQAAKEDARAHLDERMPRRYPFPASDKAFPVNKLTWGEASSVWDREEYRTYERTWNGFVFDNWVPVVLL